MYKIKNSSELANYIENTNLNNIATEKEILDFLEKSKELNFQSVVINPTYVSLAKKRIKRYRY